MRLQAGNDFSGYWSIDLWTFWIFTEIEANVFSCISVDLETEATMQDILAKEFSQQTIIAVVHRLRYIHWFDRVMLLKHGELVECDRAEALLQRDSDFRKLFLDFQELRTSV